MDFELKKLNMKSPIDPKRKPEKRKKRWWILGIAVLLISLFIWFMSQSSGSAVFQYAMSAAGGPTIKSTDDRVNVLLLGLAGGKHDGAMLTDSIIIASYHMKSNKVTMISVPRDLWMDGIKEKVNIGDILVSEVCWDWGSGKIASDFSPDHTQITIDASILTKLETIKTNQTLLDNIKNLYLGHKPSETLKMHIGPIASGASVLQNKERVNDIKKHQRKLIGIEMEIYGVMSALKYSITPSPKGICLKSVSDYGEESKSEYEAYQPYAAYTSAQVMQLLITELFKD